MASEPVGVVLPVALSVTPSDVIKWNLIANYIFSLGFGSARTLSSRPVKRAAGSLSVTLG